MMEQCKWCILYYNWDSFHLPVYQWCCDCVLIKSYIFLSLNCVGDFFLYISQRKVETFTSASSELCGQWHIYPPGWFQREHLHVEQMIYAWMVMVIPPERLAGMASMKLPVINTTEWTAVCAATHCFQISQRSWTSSRNHLFLAAACGVKFDSSCSRFLLGSDRNQLVDWGQDADVSEVIYNQEYVMEKTCVQQV